jgi:hypothetical protein
MMARNAQKTPENTGHRVVMDMGEPPEDGWMNDCLLVTAQEGAESSDRTSQKDDNGPAGWRGRLLDAVRTLRGSTVAGRSFRTLAVAATATATTAGIFR